MYDLYIYIFSSLHLYQSKPELDITHISRYNFSTQMFLQTFLFSQNEGGQRFFISTSFIWHNRPPLAAASLVFVSCSLMNNQEINSKRSRVTASGTYQFSLLVPFHCLIFRTQSMWFWMKCFDLVHILYYQLSDSMKS